MSSATLIIALLASFFVCLVFTPVVILFARRRGIVDQPDGVKKLHKKPTPLLGGLTIFLSFNLVMLFYSWYRNDLIGDTIILKNIFGIFLGSCFLAVGGYLDDKYNLKPRYQILWPIAAVMSVIVCGIGIDSMTNPFGQGMVSLNNFDWNLFWYQGFPYKITLFADLFTFVWLMGMMYTTKLLDGVDGLVSGVTVIGATFIFLTALNKGEIIQYDVAMLALILLGVFIGFLVFNFNPASIFLGEGGSTMAGFLLGALSIVSGSKVGVTLMLLSIPVLDFIWTIVRRVMENNSPFSTADRKDLHHRLLEAGFSQKQAVMFLYAIAVSFGCLVYFAQDFGWPLLGLFLVAVVVFMLILAYIYRTKIRKNRRLTMVK